jgi:hypothetical protein
VWVLATNAATPLGSPAPTYTPCSRPPDVPDPTVVDGAGAIVVVVVVVVGATAVVVVGRIVVVVVDFDGFLLAIVVVVVVVDGARWADEFTEYDRTLVSTLPELRSTCAAFSRTKLANVEAVEFSAFTA